MLKVAAIGECMIELSLGGEKPNDCSLAFAGDTFNTAVYLKRAVGEAIDVSYITVLGQDALSDRMLAVFEAEGLNVSAVPRNADRVPGLYAISTDDEGERSFTYWRDQSAAKLLFQTDGKISFDDLMAFDVLYFSAITLAILPADVCEAFLAWLPSFKAQGGQVGFDSNYRPKLWKDQATAQDAVSRAWKLCDIAMPSADDEMDLFGDKNEQEVLARLRGYGVSKGALKNGPGGPLPLNIDITTGSYPAADVVVDTTAAGDSFNGGYLAAYLTKKSEEEAMQAGHACAMKVIGKRGAIIPKDDD